MSRESLDYLKKVTAAFQEAKQRLRDYERELGEPIAVVSMACRFPGEAETPEAFWQLLEEGRDAITEVPPSRWDVDAVYDPDPDATGKTYSRVGGFVGEVDRFDPSFFGISAREARSIDPQQRLLLETTWEALERAGLTLDDMAGSATGVFVGISHVEYMMRALADAQRIDAYSGIGTAHSTTSGRVSYWLGLRGPNLAVDTACSSSLVGLHLACRALRARECDLALAAGVNLLLTPETYVYFSRLNALSAKGRCHAFSADADGYVRAEGCGVVLLKRLSDAQRDGDKIFAVVRGSAVNQDGHSNGFTAPNGRAQREVIRRALREANIEPWTVSAVECHGTGTSLGDPIEVQALAEVYGEGRLSETPLMLTSVKSNIGHAEAAAGIAGVIKAALSLWHRRLPASLHVGDRPNPHIPWEEIPVLVATDMIPLEGRGHPLRIGISSFGFSGTNAHVIVEEAPAAAGAGEAVAEERDGLAGGAVSLVVSGHSEESLRGNALRLADHLEGLRSGSEAGGAAPAKLVDVAYSLAARRTTFSHRASVTVSTEEGASVASSRLRALSQGERAAGTEVSRPRRPGKLAVLFTGQGSQRAEMGRGLYERDARFRADLDEIAGAFSGHIERPLLPLMFAEPGSEESSLLDETAFTQAALFALEVSLFRWLVRAGLRADFLLGHSIGELVAAHVAGVLSVADAARLVAARGRLMQGCPGGGSMASVEASESEVSPHLGVDVSLAGVNGPSQSVISGDASAVESVLRHFESMGRKVTRLSVSHAFHSAHMEGALAGLAEEAGRCRFHPPAIPIMSNVTGNRATAEELSSPGYWARHVREAVRFMEGVRSLVSEGARTLVECGPHGVLCGLAAGCVPEDVEVTLIPTLRKGEDDSVSFMSALGRLHVAGHRVDWESVYEGSGAGLVELPTYAWTRQRYWLEPPARGSSDASELGVDAGEHPVLRGRVDLPDGSLVLSGEMDGSGHGWLGGSRVFEAALVPGAALLDLAVHGAHAAGLTGVSEAVFETPVAVGGGARRIRLVVGPEEEGSRRFMLSSRDAREEGGFVEHGSGTLSVSVEGGGLDADLVLGAWPPPEAEVLEVAELYERLEQRGLSLSASVRCLQGVWREGATIYAEAELPEALREEAESYGLHPQLLESMLQAASASGMEEVVYWPVEWRDVRVFAVGAARVRGRIAIGSGGELRIDLFDGSEAPVARVSGVSLQPVTAELVRAALRGGRSHLYEVVAHPLGEEVAEPGPWVEVSAEAPGFAELGSGGGQTMVVRWPTSESSGAEVRAAAARGLSWLQGWLAAEELAEWRVVWVTQKGLAVRGEEWAPDLASAALWGLGRTAQIEHPDRSLVLVDVDRDLDPSSLANLVGRLPGGEGQLVVREGALAAPRLTAARALSGDGAAPAIGPSGTVLVTGGTGGLARITSRHLVEAYGARHLLLLSRSGPSAPGAGEAVAELEAAGAASVTVRACDVSDRGELEAALASVAPDQPLTAVVHAAGVLDDGLLPDLSGERLERVMRPKVDAALHLHELTSHLELSAFVLFSSVAGTLGSAAQASYAAANAALDALAARRRRQGLPGVSLAWGSFAGAGMAARLDDALKRRLRRFGLVPIDAETGMRLLDEALARPEAVLAPVPIDLAALRRTARATPEAVPALLRRLVGVGARRAGDAAGQRTAWLARRLAGRSEAEREELLIETVRGELAAVLGLPGREAVPADRPLQELGLDSLMAVEARNRLSALIGAKLPASLLFDQPTPESLARYLLAKIDPRAGEPAAGDQLGPIYAAVAALEKMPYDLLRRSGLIKRLVALTTPTVSTKPPDAAQRPHLEKASREELFAVLDDELLETVMGGD